MTRRRRLLVLACALVALGVVGLLVGASLRLGAFEARLHHTGPVTRMSFSADGRWLMSSSAAKREVFLRDLENPLDRRFGARRSRTLQGELGVLGSAVAVVARTKDEVVLLDLEKLTELRHFSLEGVSDLAVSPGGTEVAAVTHLGLRVVRLDGEGQRPFTLRLTERGRAAWGSRDRLAIAEEGAIWIQEGGGGWIVAGVDRMHGALAFAPGGHTVFAGGESEILAWTFEGDGPHWEMRGLPSTEVHVTPDGRELVVAGNGGIVLRDAATGAVRRNVTLPGLVESLAFSRDGRLVAIGGRDGRVAVESTEVFFARFR